MSADVVAGTGSRLLVAARARRMRRTVLLLERAQLVLRALAAARALRPTTGYPIPLDVFTDALAELGIERGDLVHVQSSVSHLYRGWDRETAETALTPAAYAARIVDALVEALGPEGTIVMNTDSLARDDVRRAWANLVGPGEALFDPRTAPTRRGLIAELFRRRRGAVRSPHPWYNMTALGPRAAELIGDHALSTPYTMDRHSPTYKLTMSGGKILLLGRSFAGNTPIHLVEYLHPDAFPRAIFLDRPVPMTYVAANGAVESIDVMLHASGWYVGNEEVQAYCEYLHERHGLYRRRRFHDDVEIVACDAREQYEATYAEMEANVTLFDPRFR